MPLNKPRGWDYKIVNNLLGGLNLSAASDAIADEQTIMLDNVLIRDGKVLSDTGYKIFGQVVVGQPQADYEFVRLDLTIDLMLITTATVYKYNVPKERWHLVKGTVSTTTTSGYPEGKTVIVVTSGAGFTTGDLISVALDDGDQLQTTVTVAGTSFTLAADVPVGRTISNGAVVLRAVVLAGDLDEAVSIETIPASDWMVFTNGINIVKRYNGTDCVDVPNLPSSGNTVAKAVVLYNTALFLLNTIEGGIVHSQRARRSNQTDPTDWTTGTAGYDDLLDEPSGIKSGVRLGPYLIVYREKSIARGSFLGSSGLNYVFETMVSDEGVMSPKAIVAMKDYHIFVGQTNVYEYRGDYTILPIGDNINPKLSGTAADVIPSYQHKLFALYVKELDEAWIAYVSTQSSNNACDALFRYKLKEKLWYTRHFADTLSGYGTYKAQESLIWSSLIGTWEEQTWAWSSRQTLANSPTIHLMSADTNQVYEYDYITGLDNATAISYTVETKDFAAPDYEFRFDMIEAFVRGTDILLEYSKDAGASWSSFSTFTNTSAGRLRKHKQVITNRIRFRWTGSSTNFLLTWFGLSYKPESPY